MPVTQLTSREFNQDTGRAKKAAEAGPVFITDRGRASHVLMTMADYEKLAHAQASIVDLLAMPDAGEIDFAPPRLQGPVSRPVELG
ncbi:type II toxin-antitoxin system Phd/YefM family antitoxin [Lichenifustis flavocetrariae]|uniref:Antitoxin n=1 Tax=Lichenifustis flavocetrariae TaxID=2949735 RepID=A0AA41YZG1_9HYPH|nr:type II toxin-antitoxin system Phd/YefM family antitoxin [Lichenifustis flavocetrariae]MCW6507675.1 type II toxin-antitoxin system Phd/YefM family antitoxin [Lichenifustis flavocetrariae]